MLDIYIHRCRDRSHFLSLPQRRPEGLYAGLFLTDIAVESLCNVLFLEKSGMSITLDKLGVVHDRMVKREGCFHSDNHIFKDCTPHPLDGLHPVIPISTQF